MWNIGQKMGYVIIPTDFCKQLHFIQITRN